MRKTIRICEKQPTWPNRISAKDWRADALKKKTESAVQAEICQCLTAAGIPFTRTDATISYNAKGQRVARVAEGWPDITAVLPGGKALAIECKRAVGGALRYAQAVTLRRLIDQQALVVVARDWADVRDVIAARCVPESTLDEIAAAIAKGPEMKRRRAPQRIFSR